MGDEEIRPYFVRLNLLIREYGTEILIKKVKCLLDKVDLTFKEYLNLKDQIIRDLRKKRTLTKVQFDILQMADPQLQECDITLLTTLLRNIFNTEITPPINGWDATPNENDTSFGANLVRLRFIKNTYISHEAKTSLKTKAEFEKQWLYVTGILKSLAEPFIGNEEVVFRERVDNFLCGELDISAIERTLDEIWKREESNTQKILKKTTNIDEKLDSIVVDINTIMQKEQEKQERKDMQIEELQKINQQQERELTDYKQMIKLQQKPEENRNTSTEVNDATETIQTEQTPAKTKEAEEGTFAAGDIVQIIDSLDAVEQFQVGHGGFSDSMEKCVGKYGKVMKIDKDGDLRIKFGFTSGSRSWTFNPACCSKVTVEPHVDISELLGFKSYDFAVGDVVKVIESAVDMERLQDGHGGFRKKMKLSLGKLGRIIKIDGDGDLYVKTEPHKWLLHPECCIKVTDESLIAKAPIIDRGDDDDDDDMSNLGGLLKLKRKLDILKDLFDEDSSNKTITLDNGESLSVGDEVQIIEDLETVQQLQKGHGGWVDGMKKSLGKIGIVKRFLEKSNGYLVHVKFDVTKWTFNPLCCSKIDKPQPEKSERQPCNGQSTGLTHIEKFNKQMANILGTLGVAAYCKEVEIFKELKNMKKGSTQMLVEKLDKNPYLVNSKYMDVSLLQLACYLGKPEAIKCLMEKNVDLQAKFGDGNTALHSATYGQLSRVISLLLESGVNPNEKNKEGFTSLHIAVENGSVTCAKVLLENNASVNIQDNQGNTPMHACTVHRSAKTELIDAIFSVDNADFGIQNSKGKNVLQYLSENNCYRAAEIVCERKPDIINVHHEKQLYTALHICAKWNHDLVAEVILKHGGNPDIVNNHMSTPLHLAVKEGHQRFVELLVQNGCKLDAQDDNGNTALHLAQKLKPEKREVAYRITQILTNRRANVEIRNNEGKLPVDLCNDMNTKKLFKRDFSSNWDPVEGTKSIFFTLSENEDEYQDVCKQFKESLPNANIFTIKRVQNKYLLNMYKTAKDHMEESHTAQNINEKHLFHGTRPDLVNDIRTKLFDPRRSGCLDHPLGEGAYYATKAECADKLVKANGDQHKFMILCSVLTGRWALGKPSYVNPPPTDPADPDSECFDSCVDNVNDPTMFCVFHQYHFYPKYIIEFADIEELSNSQ